MTVGKPLSVEQALTLSRAAHRRYRDLHDRFKNGDLNGMRDAVSEALDARQAAMETDPTRSDPAWAFDTAENRGVKSDDLMAFYRTYLIGARAQTFTNSQP